MLYAGSVCHWYAYSIKWKIKHFCLFIICSPNLFTGNLLLVFTNYKQVFVFPSIYVSGDSNLSICFDIFVHIFHFIEWLWVTQGSSFLQVIYSGNDVVCNRPFEMFANKQYGTWPARFLNNVLSFFNVIYLCRLQTTRNSCYLGNSRSDPGW